MSVLSYKGRFPSLQLGKTTDLKLYTAFVNRYLIITLYDTHEAGSSFRVYCLIK